MRRPRRVLALVALVTVVAAALMLRVRIDTDPENMLSADDPARVTEDFVEATFGVGDMVVVGLVDPVGVDDAATLAAAVDLHAAIAGLDGVVTDQVVSVASAVDDDEVAALRRGDDAAGQAVLDEVAADPVLAGNVVSADGDALAFFVPLVDKSDAQPVRDAVQDLVAASPTLVGLETHVGGLPLAQEAFGDEMFVQMAVFAPLAGLVVFAAMLVFFRRIRVVWPAMVVALVSVVWTMGALIGSGQTVHIMSSMIPIFLMPIAILDAVHILSELRDDRRGDHPGQSFQRIHLTLRRPLAFTTITTAVGFGALALTPIPPVRVFGIFVALGVGFAWLLTTTLLPALVATAPVDAFSSTTSSTVSGTASRRRRGDRAGRIGRSAARRPVVTVGAFALVVAVAVPALFSIQVNDNPVRWFRADHDVRESTEALNEQLPGTFAASLLVHTGEPGGLTDPELTASVARLQQRWADLDVVGASVSWVDLVGTDGGREDVSAALAGARDAEPVAATLVDADLEVANVRLQLRSGDNTAMQQVIDATDAHLAADPLPGGVRTEWAGESHLNLVWQDEMVTGMARGFVVTLVAITLLVMVLMRSVRWGLLTMLPVAWTVLVVYGFIGVTGRDFDMPVAVLSTLVLGIGVDFAIHFVQRYRQMRRAGLATGSALDAMADEPARALTRNAVVIAVGFTPLFASSLVPYVVVAALLASIIAVSWFATVVGMPSVIALADRPRHGPVGGGEVAVEAPPVAADRTPVGVV